MEIEVREGGYEPGTVRRRFFCGFQITPRRNITVSVMLESQLKGKLLEYHLVCIR